MPEVPTDMPYPEAPPRTISPGHVTFKWNGRHCTGNTLHLAAFDGNSELARAELCRSKNNIIDARFTYETFFQGRHQEGSGLAIHVAASRGHIAVVELLLSYQADIETMVTRGNQDHYDVLHAAVWAEGRSDNDAMVEYLLSLKAPITQNSDKWTPLHHAFRTGSLRQIKMLRQAMREQGWEHNSGTVENLGVARSGASIDSMAALGRSDVLEPLVVGIKFGKMSQTQLAEAAAKEPRSLWIFIEHEPRCIPAFVRKVAKVGSAKLAERITSEDVAGVLRRCPPAACALLEAVTTEPVCWNAGWHALPTRMSFAPRGFQDHVRSLFNPTREVIVNYVIDKEWKFDAVNFEKPAWHEDLQWPCEGDPVYDVSTRVCHIKDLISPQLFAALEQVPTKDHDIFESHVIIGAIEQVWWEAAFHVDTLNGLLGFWGLLLLLVEEWFEEDLPGKSGVEGDASGAIARSLIVRPSLGAEEVWHSLSSEVAGLSISAAFLGAKGFVDFFHEVLQFVGFVRIGHGWEYCNFGNFLDLVWTFTLMCLLFHPENPTVRVCVILCCWMRLLEMFTAAEKVAVTLLPIKRLAPNMAPACIVTGVVFGAFTHSFHSIWGYNHDWKRTFLRSFATLITTELPQDPESSSSLVLVVTYCAVLIFSIFILNIFIGVIGTTYESEMNIAPRTFKHHRASCCATFLLRAQILPCDLCTKAQGKYIAQAFALVTLALQIFCFFYHHIRGLSVIFVVLQLTMILATYQHAGLWGTEEGQHRYLWVTVPKPLQFHSEDEAPTDNEENGGSRVFNTRFHHQKTQSFGPGPSHMSRNASLNMW